MKDYRILQVDIRGEDTIVFPWARLDDDGYITFKTMTSASDDKPRTFVLQRGANGSLVLVAK